MGFGIYQESNRNPHPRHSRYYTQPAPLGSSFSVHRLSISSSKDPPFPKDPPSHSTPSPIAPTLLIPYFSRLSTFSSALKSSWLLLERELASDTMRQDAHQGSSMLFLTWTSSSFCPETPSYGIGSEGVSPVKVGRMVHGVSFLQPAQTLSSPS
ncbi:hypothetical protein CC80DRAFT_327947 [Byssothecium circinans]|uniref:Uncharacterized protein n=1 Tax=Byssothecium circinans TaxID=147558 RepID=A0A6A5T5P6_9PLEO|nr:hypothetical protein CC80DRAFT_327947 [Byssothecium circinans]